VSGVEAFFLGVAGGVVGALIVIIARRMR